MVKGLVCAGEGGPLSALVLLAGIVMSLVLEDRVWFFQLGTSAVTVISSGNGVTGAGVIGEGVISTVIVVSWPSDAGEMSVSGTEVDSLAKDEVLVHKGALVGWLVPQGIPLLFEGAQSDPEADKQVTSGPVADHTIEGEPAGVKCIEV